MSSEASGRTKRRPRLERGLSPPRAHPVRRRGSPAAASNIEVIVDLAHPAPVTARELEVLERHLGTLLDGLFT